MEYTVSALAKLSGVTARTIRWYDEVGLLKPARITEAGYRLYGPEQVDRLRDILFYKALGLELSAIKEALESPDYDRAAALHSHLAALEGQKARLEALITAVRHTIEQEERNIPMTDEEKFAAFKNDLMGKHEAAYGAEARKNYGAPAVDSSNAAVAGMSREQYEAWTALDRAILAALEQAVASGLAPDSAAGKAVAGDHAAWLRYTVKNYTPTLHRGIAALYTADGRFTAYYDRTTPGCAAFLTAAVNTWIK